MRYLEFQTSNKIIKVANVLLESYSLVEAISVAQQKKLLQNITAQLQRELGQSPKQDTDIRSVLSTAGFTGDYIKKVMKTIEPKSKTKAKAKEEPSQEQPDEPEQTEQPDKSTSSGTSAQGSFAHQWTVSAQDKTTKTAKTPDGPQKPEKTPEVPFSIKLSVDNAKKVAQSLLKDIPNLDPEVRSDLTGFAKAVKTGIDNNDPKQVQYYLKAQIDLINDEIAKKQPKTETLNEFASAGSTNTSTGAVLTAPLGAIVRRMPQGQSFFAPMQQQQPKKTRKKAKKTKKHKAN